MTESSFPKPYVGPQPFSIKDRERFFGREDEIEELVPFIMVEHFVLICAPSGVGKSSLVNAGIIPNLIKKKYKTFLVDDVHNEPVTDQTGINPYIYSLILSIEKTFSEASLTPKKYINLCDYFQYLFKTSDDSDQETYLFIDQMEKIFIDPVKEWPLIKEFFSQITNLYELFPQLSIVLIIRDDFLAKMDQFMNFLPNMLQSRYHVPYLSREAALDAIQRPVETLRPFEPEAAKLVVDSLVEAMVGDTDEDLARQIQGIVEPGQLQIVCYQLWEQIIKSEPSGKTITKAKLDALSGNNMKRFIDKALMTFYDDAIQEVCQTQERTAAPISELELRDWLESNLIRGNARDIVLCNPEEEQISSAINSLHDKRILQLVDRPGGEWYELVHDRFIELIKSSNAKYLAKFNDHWLKVEYKKWSSASADEKSRLLLDDKKVEKAEQEIKTTPQIFEDINGVQRFINESKKENQKKKNQQNLTLLFVSIVIILISATGWFFSYQNEQKATQNAEIANVQRSTSVAAEAKAKEQEKFANANMKQAIEQASTAEALKKAETNLRTIAQTAEANAQIERNKADAASEKEKKQKVIAQASELSSLADYFRYKRLDLSLLLSIESVKLSDGWVMRKGIFEGINFGKQNQVKEVGRFSPSCTHSSALAYSYDGKLLAVGCDNGTVTLWGWDGQNLTMAKPTPHQFNDMNHMGVTALSISRDNRVIASGTIGGRLRLWLLGFDSVIELTDVAFTHGQWSSINGLTFQPNENKLAIISGNLPGYGQIEGRGQVVLYDYQTNQILARKDCGPYDCIALSWSYDGEWLAVGNAHGDIQIFDDELNETKRFINPGKVNDLAWFPNSRLLLSGGTNGLAIWDRNESRSIKESNLTNVIYHLALSPDGSTILAGTGEEGKYLSLWNAQTLERLAVNTDGHTLLVTSIVADRVNGNFITTSYDNRVILWKLSPINPFYKELDSRKTANIFGILQNDLEDRWIARMLSSQQVAVYKNASDTPVKCIFSAPLYSAFLYQIENQPFIAGGGLDGKIYFCDVENQKVLQNTVTVGAKLINTLAVSQNQAWIAASMCAAADLQACNEIRIINQKTNSVLNSASLSARINSEHISSLLFDPGEENLVIGTGSGRIFFFNLKTNEISEALTEGLTVEGSKIAVSRMAFGGENNNMLAAGFHDGTISIWESSSHNPIGEFNDQKIGSVNGLLFTKKDGKWNLISITDEGEMFEWIIDLVDWIDRACQIAKRNLTADEISRFLHESTSENIITCPQYP